MELKTYIFVQHMVLYTNYNQISYYIGLFSGKAISKIDSSPIEKIFITNTIPRHPDNKSDKIEVISVGTLLAEVIRRIDMNVSLTTVIIKLLTYNGI